MTAITEQSDPIQEVPIIPEGWKGKTVTHTTGKAGGDHGSRVIGDCC